MKKITLLILLLTCTTNAGGGAYSSSNLEELYNNQRNQTLYGHLNNIIGCNRNNKTLAYCDNAIRDLKINAEEIASASIKINSIQRVDCWDWAGPGYSRKVIWNTVKIQSYDVFLNLKTGSVLRYTGNLGGSCADEVGE
jgi:hypothetical protein